MSKAPKPSQQDNPLSSSEDYQKQYLSMATEDFNNSLIALLRTRTNLIYISTNEENRLLDYLQSVSIARGYEPFEWDCFRLLRKLKKNETITMPATIDARYPEGILSFVISELEKKKNLKEPGNGSIYILCDFYRYLSPERCSPQIERQLKHINRITSNCHVILTGPNYITNPALEKEISALDFPFPNEGEIRSILFDLVDTDKVKTGFPGIGKEVELHQEELINSVKGLTTIEASQAYAKSIVMSSQLGVKPFDINIILQEKKQIIKKTDILEYVDSTIDMQDVGGLDDLSHWLNLRKQAFTKDAAEYGLKPPRGVLLLGMPGCGKSLTAKAAASLYEMPLLRLDFGKMFNSLVGESEKIARHVIKLAETVAPCVSGNSVVYDENGKSHLVKDLLESVDKKPFYTYSFNEKTLKLEKTRVKAIIRHAEQKKMLRLRTAVGSIEVTHDHKMMVNRDGKLVWVEAKDLVENDLLITPKTLRRDKKTLSLTSLFPGKKEGNISMRANGKLHKACINDKHLNLIQIATVFGMMDACGTFHKDTGEIMFHHADPKIRFFFAGMMSESFLTEPSFENNMVLLTNKVVTHALAGFKENLASQSKEILSFYLAGFFHGAGYFGFADAQQRNPVKPFVAMKCNTPSTFQRVKTVLHAFGIISFLSPQSCIVMETEQIERFFHIIPIFNRKRVRSVEGFMDLVVSSPMNRVEVVGYQLGKVLSAIRHEYGITELEYNDQEMAVFEQPNAFVNQNVAIDLHDFLTANLARKNLGEMTKLLSSDVVGVKIDSIQIAETQWAYDLSCEKNHNFFANGFLCHNCILWADEIEKGLAGGVGQGSGDSGTTKRVIGTFLTWLQEKTAPVFVICTANNVQDIPPEFMRAGRFDEVFFVDLPNHIGRRQIYEVLLKKFKFDSSKFDTDALASSTDGFSGAEIEKTIENAMFECFCDGKRPITTRDLMASCKSICALSSTRAEDFSAMRKWAEGRCKFANTRDKVRSSNQKKGHDLDL